MYSRQAGRQEFVWTENEVSHVNVLLYPLSGGSLVGLLLLSTTALCCAVLWDIECEIGWFVLS